MSLTNELQYLKVLNNVLENGIDTGDRTGTGMRSLFGETMEFDLRKGFPLITTKKMFTRGVFAELLWFLSGSTSGKELREKYNVQFWKEWEDEFGELNNIYGKQWMRQESPRKIVKVEKKIIKYKNEINNIKVNDIENPRVPNTDSIVGKKFNTNNSGQLIVLDFNGYYYDSKGKNKGRTYKIQFINTGYIANNIKKENIVTGEVKDPYHRRVFGVGYMGNIKVEDEVEKSLHAAWRNMLERCYSVNCKNYKYYGGKGIEVSQEWHCFENFSRDVKKIPNWHKKKHDLNNYHLDKDYFCSNVYSKDTCVWLHKEENKLYSKSKPFYIIGEGIEELFINISECARKFGLDASSISKCLLGKINSHKSYEFKYLDYNKEKYTYRYALPFNQIKYIIDEIKSNPTSRRILFTGWNAPEMQWEDTALPCCHSTVVQFWVEGKNIHMYHYQRSGDLFLGVPVNIASYATLLTMIAQQCDLIPATIKHTVGIAHIYHNHIDQVKEQLTRTPYKLPKLNIKRKPDSIFDYELDDFEVVDYKCHPKIKGDVAV